MPLYANERLRTAFLRMEAGAQLPDRAVTGGEETFVLEGEVQIGGERQGRWGWRRNAARQQPAIVAVAPTLLWLKRGHL
jgi:hypothetical protein